MCFSKVTSFGKKLHTIRYFWRYENSEDNILGSLENLVLHTFGTSHINNVSIFTNFYP